MYIARFSYDILPVHREQAISFIQQEVDDARKAGLSARLLVPFTRGPGCAALQFEVELTTLDQLDQFRHRGGAGSDIGEFMRSFRQILQSPPAVEILRVRD